MRRVVRRTVAALLGLAISAAMPAFSQSLTGAITGRALDGSGAVLPGVVVTISSPAMIGGARSAVTDAQGVYRFTQLARNPNEAAYRAQSTNGVISTDFPPELVQTYQGVRLSGTYELPWKILVASTFTGRVNTSRASSGRRTRSTRSWKWWSRVRLAATTG